MRPYSFQLLPTSFSSDFSERARVDDVVAIKCCMVGRATCVDHMLHDLPQFNIDQEEILKPCAQHLLYVLFTPHTEKKKARALDLSNVDPDR